MVLCWSLRFNSHGHACQEERIMADQPTAESRSPEPSRVERPSPAAELRITVRPDAHAWVTASGRVPPDDARYLIRTLGITGSAFAGAGAAVLTFYISHAFTWLAIAEIALALVAIIFIALAGRDRRRRSLCPVTQVAVARIPAYLYGDPSQSPLLSSRKLVMTSRNSRRAAACPRRTL